MKLKKFLNKVAVSLICYSMLFIQSPLSVKANENSDEQVRVFKIYYKGDIKEIDHGKSADGVNNIKISVLGDDIKFENVVDQKTEVLGKYSFEDMIKKVFEKHKDILDDLMEGRDSELSECIIGAELAMFLFVIFSLVATIHDEEFSPLLIVSTIGLFVIPHLCFGSAEVKKVDADSSDTKNEEEHIILEKPIKKFIKFLKKELNNLEKESI